MGSAEYLAAMEDDDDIRCAVLTGDDKRRGLSRPGANLKSPQTHKLDLDRGLYQKPSESARTANSRCYRTSRNPCSEP